MVLPPGLAFVPTDHQVILDYLFRKSNGLPLASFDYVSDNCDTYGDENIWMSKFCETNRKELYFFSKLRKKSNRGLRIDRVTLNGTWKETHSKKILHQNKIIGTKHFLKFIPKKGYTIEGRWLMDEFRIAGDLINSVKDTSVVFCKIAHKKSLKSRIEGVQEGLKTLEFAPSTLSSQICNDESVESAPTTQTTTTSTLSSQIFSDEIVESAPTMETTTIEPLEQIKAREGDDFSNGYSIDLDLFNSMPEENLEDLLASL